MARSRPATASTRTTSRCATRSRSSRRPSSRPRPGPRTTVRATEAEGGEPAGGPTRRWVHAGFVVVVLVSLIAGGCGDRQGSEGDVSQAPAVAPVGDVDEAAIRYLERRVKDDPENFVAYNKLAGYYLQRMRENGSITYLDLAGRAARASLAALPAERNTGGLAMLAQVELAAHDFTRAREHGSRLRELDPGASFPLQILGDALLELGDYHGAASAFRRMARLVERRGESRLNLEMRLARLAFLHGQTDDAERRPPTARPLALEGDPPPPATAGSGSS